MSNIVKFEQKVLDNETATEKPFAVSAPFKIAGDVTFELLAWNGVGYTTMGSVTEPSYVASAGKYAITGGPGTVTVTPYGG